MPQGSANWPVGYWWCTSLIWENSQNHGWNWSQNHTQRFRTNLPNKTQISERMCGIALLDKSIHHCPPRYHHMPYVLHSLVSSTNTLQLIHNTSWDVGRPKKDNTSNQHVLGALSSSFVQQIDNCLFPLQFLSSKNVPRPYKNQEDNKPQLSHCSFVAATALNGAMMPMTRRRSRLWVNGSLIIRTGKRIMEDGHHEKRC